MSNSTLNQWAVLLSAVYAGMLCGPVYDVIRIFRRTFHFKRVLTAITDILFWVLCAAILFFVLLGSNSGQVRPFSVLGAALGFTIYILGVSPFIMTGYMKISEKVKNVLRKRRGKKAEKAPQKKDL